MNRALLAVGVPAALIFVLFIVHAAMFRVHVGVSSYGSGDIEGVLLFRDGVRCIAGPVTLVSAWVAAGRLEERPGSGGVFSVRRFGRVRTGSTDEHDPNARAVYQLIHGGGWLCRRYGP